MGQFPRTGRLALAQLGKIHMNENAPQTAYTDVCQQLASLANERFQTLVRRSLEPLKRLQTAPSCNTLQQLAEYWRVIVDAEGKWRYSPLRWLFPLNPQQLETELRVLEDTYTVSVSNPPPRIYVELGPITLDGYYLGNFTAVFGFDERLCVWIRHKGLLGPGMTPNIPHPHVQFGVFDAGEARLDLRTMLAAGELVAAIELIHRGLQQYNWQTAAAHLGEPILCECQNLARGVCKVCSRPMCRDCQTTWNCEHKN